MEELKKNTIQKITDHFKDASVKEYPGNRVDFTVPKKTVPSMLLYLKEEMGYNNMLPKKTIHEVEILITELEDRS